MPRAKAAVDNRQEVSVVEPDLVGGNTFIMPTDSDSEPPTMMAPIRRKHPPTIVVVLEAINKLDDKKGSTYTAIKNWIMANYPEFNRNRLKLMVTKALEKGVKENKLRRNPGEVANPVTVGRFKLLEGKPVVKKSKPKKQDGDVPATISKTVPKNKIAKKQTKSSKKTVAAESVSDTEAEKQPSKVPAARRRRSVSESAATTSSKIVKRESKKNVEPAKTAATKKTVARSSSSHATVKKTTSDTKKKTAIKKE